MSEDLEVFNDEKYIPNESKRPTFIKVLAILSWIYVGFGLISGLISSFVSEENQLDSIDNTIAIYEDMDSNAMPFGEDMIEFLEASKDHMKLNSLGQLLMLLIEGIAVFLMFNLKKSGFWLYTLSQIGILAIVAYSFPLGNSITIISLVINGLIILVFEILYAVNLKHMK